MGQQCSRILAVEQKVELLAKDLETLTADLSKLKQDTAVKQVVEDLKETMKDAVK